MIALALLSLLLGYLAGRLGRRVPESSTNHALLHAQTELHLLRTGLHGEN